jgi:exopolysaccharide biosynthesis polyprenyl glycosylphosphotransferase
MLKRLRANDALLRFILDLTLTEVALFLSGVLGLLVPVGSAIPFLGTDLPLSIYALVALIWGGALLMLSLYTPRNRRAIDEAQAVFGAATLSALTLAGILFFSLPGVSRLQILTFYVLDLLFLFGIRFVVRLSQWLIGQPRRAKRRVLILGAGEAGRDVLSMIHRHRRAGLETAGFLDDTLPVHTEVQGCPVLGRVAEVARYVESEEVDEVIVALPLGAYDRFFRFIAGLQNLPVRVRVVPDYIKTALFRAMLEDFAGMSVITLRRPSLTPFERQIKRAFDMIVGAVMFALSLPLWTLISAAIYLDSPGPVIFRQQRVGEDGKLFWMFKFRSMIKGAEEQEGDLLSLRDDGQLVFKHVDDPRVTRVGRLIRRTSLDELPQILNVLRGEMSLVGPRPELPWIVEQYESWQWQRFAVPQGITGWWQVNGRSDKPMHLHTEEDLYYIQNYSLSLDIRILWQTVGAVIRGRGAY